MSFHLACSECKTTIRSDPADMLARLRHLGMLRRSQDPPWEELAELFEASRDRLLCPHCRHVGLRVLQRHDHETDVENHHESAHADDCPDDDWPEVRTCEVCHEKIPLERLEIFPDSKRCAVCVERQTEPQTEDDFCPRCGGQVGLRQTGRSGITRYESACPACGWKASR